MKQIWISVCLLLCVLLFAGCHDDTYRAITMNNADWLYEKLPSSVKIGETVTVKIKKRMILATSFW